MDSFELSFQQRVLLGETTDTAIASECIVAIGDLAAGGLQDAVDSVVREYEILRTTFRIPDGLKVPLQFIDDVDAVKVTIADGPDTGAAHLSAWIGEVDGARVLGLCAPSALADAQSLTALAGVITARAAGSASPAGDDEPLQYADFAAWQEELAQQSDAAALEASAHWRAQQRSDLATFGSEPAVEPAGSTEFEADPEFAQRVSLAAASASVSIETLWSTAWATLVARVVNDGNLVLAVGVDGRQNDELLDAVGALLTYVPVRVDAAADLSVSAAVKQVAATTAASTRHALRAEQLGVVTASFRCDVVDTTTEPQVVWRSDAQQAADAHCSVSIVGGRVRIRVLGSPLLRRIAASHLVPLVCSISDGLLAKDDDATLGSLNAWEAAARNSALAASIALAATNPNSSTTLFDAVAETARLTPDAVAVVSGDGSLSYRELSDRATQVAHALHARGIAPRSNVGLLVDRSCDAIVGLLGIIGSGSAYVPLHGDHPTDRFAQQLASANATCVVTSDVYSAKLPVGIDCIAINDDAVRAQPTSPLAVSVGGGDLAYVIFTSGSTGVPKGVGVTHANLMAYATAANERLLTGSVPRSFGLVTSITTDLGNTSLVLALTTGGTLLVAPSDVAVDPNRYLAWANEHRTDVLKVTPSHLKALLSAGDGVLPHELLIMGGEALPWSLVRDVESRSNCAVANHYGPTETTIGALTHLVHRGVQHPASATVPIGAPLPGYRTYVMDAAGNPTPDGLFGELCIGGSAVAVGYLGRDDFTAERFVADPSGGRMYKTGDVVRRHEDGAIEFIGRADGQVKIRGYRVEPGEVEAVLAQHELVTHAAVVPLPEPSGDLRLVAYVVSSGSSASDMDALRKHLGEVLPPHMIPSLLLPIATMPFTASGKIDRRALPDPSTISLDGDDDYVAPRDDVEQVLADVWAELLGVERVGIEDDFFGLGGHSLLAAQVIARILRDFGVHLPLHTLFVAPTVALLADTVREEQIAAVGGDEEFERMLAELEDLDDDAAAALLADEGNSATSS